MSRRATVNIKRRGCEFDGNWGGTGEIAREEKEGINLVNTVLIKFSKT